MTTSPLLTLILLLASTTLASATDSSPMAHEAMQGGMTPPHQTAAMGGMHNDAFLVKKLVDGYQISFHVMNPAGVKNGDTPKLMVRIEQDKQPLHNLTINSKVIYPDTSTETKAMQRMGDWYMAAYNFKHGGMHQLLVLFKTADGRKHKAGTYYSGQANHDAD